MTSPRHISRVRERPIGEFGQPIIRKKADQMLNKFIDNIKKELAAN